MTFVYIILGIILIVIAIFLLDYRDKMTKNIKSMNEYKDDIKNLNEQLDHINDTLKSLNEPLSKIQDASQRILNRIAK